MRKIVSKFCSGIHTDGICKECLIILGCLCVAVLFRFSCFAYVTGSQSIYNTCKVAKCNRIVSTCGFCENHAKQYKLTLRKAKGASSFSNVHMNFDTEEREWKDKKGRSLWGSWTSCAKDLSYIYIFIKSKDKYQKVTVKGLCEEDQNYIHSRVDPMIEAKWKWEDGMFFEPSEYENIKKAERIVLEKSYQAPISFKVFQLVHPGALAYTESGNRNGVTKFDGDLFFLNDNVDGVLNESSEIKDRYLYWASTYQYINRRDEERVVNAYCLDFGRAVFKVRAKLGLYTKKDPKYSLFEAINGRGVAQPQNKQNPQPEYNGKEILASTGSGFIVTEDGYIVTNEHVVNGARRLEVLTNKGKYSVSVVKTDKNLDLALLKIDASTMPFMKLSNRRKACLGEEVFTIGFPMPGDQGYSPKVTKGVLSSENGYQDSPYEYQIDAAIQPGNSGGALCDAKGNVIGVTSSTLKSEYFLKQSGNVPQNVNYAIKKSYLLAFLDSVTQCSSGLIESDEGPATIMEAVDKVRNACVLVFKYK